MSSGKKLKYNKGLVMPEQCEQCDEPGVGYNDDGEFLCEDCMFESILEDHDGIT
jgi:hypothetical protein